MKWVQEKWRLFNTELRMLAPQQCYDAAITDGTYTILLMRESDINIDHEPLLSAMKIGIEAKEQTPNPRPQKDLSEILWSLSSCGPYTHSSPDSEDTYSATIEKYSKGFAVVSVSEVRANKISRPRHGRKGGVVSRLYSMDISGWLSILRRKYELPATHNLLTARLLRTL